MGETDKDDAFYTFFACDGAEVFKVAGVGGGQELFGARLEEHAGEVDDRMAVAQGGPEAFGIGEVPTDDFRAFGLMNVLGDVPVVDK